MFVPIGYCRFYQNMSELFSGLKYQVAKNFQMSVGNSLSFCWGAHTNTHTCAHTELMIHSHRSIYYEIYS